MLGDEEKRKLYDEGGEEALKESGGGKHDAYDIFDMFFGGGGRRKRDNRTKDMVYPLKVCICMYVTDVWRYTYILCKSFPVEMR